MHRALRPDAGPEAVCDAVARRLGLAAGAAAAPARNAPCPCGSGKKYKRCCGAG
ncbi:MAG: SEC-C domain-containing protein [Myxococcales bacterium]|nr:SEC-C domain-containing protein [Myxococcales bacterium]